MDSAEDIVAMLDGPGPQCCKWINCRTLEIECVPHICSHMQHEEQANVHNLANY